MELNSRNLSRILIVDDVEECLEKIKKIVENMGYIVQTALGVQEAFECMAEQLPDMILTDIVMPGIDGYQFISILKQDSRKKEIPVIFVSALDSPNHRTKGIKLGAVDFIQKSLSESEIAARIATHMKMSQMQREVDSYTVKLNAVINEQRKKIEENQKSMLFALATMTEGENVGRSGNHLEVISYNSRFLAQSLAFSPKFEKQITSEFIEKIGVAALLHDIGKLMMDDKFRNNRSSLSQEELYELRVHSEKGAILLENIYHYCGDNAFLPMAIDIARYHHERYDGSGYPKGLKEDDIPLAARIVRIICSYDKMTSVRVYDEPFSVEDALEKMKLKSGNKYDPYILEVFERIVHQLKIAVYKEREVGEH